MLLALAVPVQGMAAASMVGCAQGHGEGHAAVAAPAHGNGVTPVDIGLQEMTEGRHHHHPHVHAHATSAPEAVMASAFTLDDTATPNTVIAGSDPNAGDSPATCSACATCCVGAILISSGGLSAVLHQALLPQFSTSGLAVSFITDGPQRPPRPAFA